MGSHITIMAPSTQEDEEDKKEDERHSKSRSINYIVRSTRMVNRFAEESFVFLHGGGSESKLEGPHLISQKRVVNGNILSAELESGIGKWIYFTNQHNYSRFAVM
ncbi:hypothetical protein YC2023_019491 [Brassica napus]